MHKKVIVDNRVNKNLSGLINLFHFVNTVIKKESKHIIELGSFIGTSTKLFSEYFPQSTIFAIDMWKNDFDLNDPICQFDMKTAERMFDQNIKKCKNIIKIKMNTNNFCKILKNNFFDFIYIDANHSYEGCLMDIKNYFPKVKKKGILAGHDFIDKEYSAVKKAVLEVFGECKYLFEDTSWGIIKNEV